MSESIIATSMMYCMVCGKPATEVHHLICGTGNRKKADEDGLTVPLCRKCHNEIHTAHNGAYYWTHALAEEAWINANKLPFEDREATIDRFRGRYGKNYL